MAMIVKFSPYHALSSCVIACNAVHFPVEKSPGVLADTSADFAFGCVDGGCTKIA